MSDNDALYVISDSDSSANKSTNGDTQSQVQTPQKTIKEKEAPNKVKLQAIKPKEQARPQGDRVVLPQRSNAIPQQNHENDHKRSSTKKTPIQRVKAEPTKQQNKYINSPQQQEVVELSDDSSEEQESDDDLSGALALLDLQPPSLPPLPSDSPYILPNDALQHLQDLTHFTYRNHEIPPNAYKIFMGHEWLTDENINPYMDYLQRQYPRTFFFSTFFYTSLPRDRSWTKKINIFDRTIFDRVVVPINLNSHWFVIVVDWKQQCFTVLDSMSPATHYADKIYQYLCEESIRRKEEFFTPARLRQFPRIAPRGVPKQTDGSSCGLFLALFARTAALEKIGKWDWGPKEAVGFRRRMLWDLVNDIST